MNRLLITALLLVATGSSLAQAAGKVAVINVQQAILSTDVAKVKLQTLEKDPEVKTNLDEAKRIQAEGKKLADQYQKNAATMSAADRQALEAKIKGKEADIEHVMQKLDASKSALVKSLMYSMGEQASKLTKEIVTAEGIGLLLAGNPQIIYYADPSYDMTSKLTDKLNAANKTATKK